MLMDSSDFWARESYGLPLADINLGLIALMLLEASKAYFEWPEMLDSKVFSIMLV